MSGKLAKTTYEAGPEDKLIVKDVYEATSSAVVNSYQEIDSSVYSLVDKIPSMNLGELMNRVNSALSAARGVMSAAAGGLAGAAGLARLGGLGNAAGLAGGLTAGGFGGLAGLASGSLGALGGLGALGKLGNLGASGALGLVGNLGNFGELRSIVGTMQASMGGVSSLVSQINRTVSTASGLEHAITGQLSQVLGGDVNAFMSIARQISNQSTMFTSNSGLSSYSDYDARVGYSGLDNLAQHLSNGNLDVFSSINDLPSNATSQLNGGLTSTQITGNVVAQVGGVLTQLSASDSAETAKPIANIVNALTDNGYEAKITNKGSTAALISAVSHIGNQLNMPNVFSSIAEKVEDKTILTEAARPLIQRAIEDGNMSIIENIANTKIAGDMKNIAPSLVQSMLSNMSKPETLAQQEYSKHYQGVRESFDAIDSEWATYNRAGGVCVNAASIKDNYFVIDLIRSQLNELMHPSTYVSNLQRVYGENNNVDTDVIDSLGALVNAPGSGNTGAVVDLSQVVVVDYEFGDEGSAVNPRSDSITTTVDGKSKTMSFENEPFLLLSFVYLEDSVDECLKRDFPEWYSGLDVTPIAECAF